MGVQGCREDGVLEAPGLTCSPGAPNIALHRSLRHHNTRLKEYFPFLICKRGAYIIYHPTSLMTKFGLVWGDPAYKAPEILRNAALYSAVKSSI